MANHKSAQKRHRQTIKRTASNRTRVKGIRASLKKVEEAISSGDKKSANAALKAAQPKLMKGVSKGAANKKAASRKISRLSARIKKISG
jgi:small subunit ribosomal protein S20